MFLPVEEFNRFANDFIKKEYKDNELLIFKAITIKNFIDTIALLASEIDSDFYKINIKPTSK